MGKTSTVRARIEPDLKERVEEVFARLGISPTQAITIFYRQIEMRNGLPFDLGIPTDVTKKTFHATDECRDLIVCENADDMFAKLRI